MKKNRLSPEEELIFLCSRTNINNSVIQKIEKIIACPLKWSKIIKIAIQQEVPTFLYYNLTRLNLSINIPDDVSLKLKQYYYLNLEKNIKFEKEVLKLLGLANNKGISAVALKGLSLLQCVYKNPALRIMADVDILVKIEDFEKMASLLKQLDLKENINHRKNKENRDYRHMAIFSKKLSANLFLIIEIHGILVHARPYEIHLSCLWERAYETNSHGQKILSLSNEDIFISLILHMRSHLRRLKLKFIIDIAELINYYKNTLDWTYIIRMAEINHIKNSVFLFLYLAEELLDAEIDCKIFNEIKPNFLKIFFIKFLINKNNFFNLTKGKAVLIRFLVFDKNLDFFFYLWKVSFLEKFIGKIGFLRNNIKKTQTTTKEAIKK